MEETVSPHVVSLLARRPGDITIEPFEAIDGLRTEFGESPSDDLLSSSDILLVVTADAAWAASMVARIRSRPELFLKPLATICEESCRQLAALVDDELVLPAARTHIGELIDSLCGIDARIRALPLLGDELPEGRLPDLLMLRFLYTRPERRLDPKIDTGSPVGYSYPLVRTLFGKSAGEEFATVESWERSALVSGKLVDRINLCPHCGAYNINFREICPSCSSFNTPLEVTLHHYRCGFIGPEHDFMREEELVCPKCSHPLRHIGVDYDKPAQNLWCKDCGLNFAEPLLSCFCLNCDTVFTPDYAVSKPIASYELTAEGQRAAETGFLPGIGLADILKGDFGYYRIDTFREFLKVESHRCARYGTPSCLVRFRLENLSEIAASEGLERAHQLQSEIASVLREHVRNSDVLTSLDHNDILVLMTNTPVANVDVAIKRFEESCTALFARDLNLDCSVIAVGEDTVDLDAAIGRKP